MPIGDDAVTRLELVAAHRADDSLAVPPGDLRCGSVVGLPGQRVRGGDTGPPHRHGKYRGANNTQDAHDQTPHQEPLP